MEYGIYNTSWSEYAIIYSVIFLFTWIQFFKSLPSSKMMQKKHNQIQGSLNISTLYFFVIGFQKGHHGVKMINEKF